MSIDRAGLALFTALLGGCATELDVPEYDADYARQGSAVVPAACQGQAEPGPNDSWRLPMGCANALNLQHMVERQDDLQRGRSMGPTLSAPIARAAQKYVQGEQAPLPAAPTTTSEVPVQP